MTWLRLFGLGWLTGEDGRPAFWKLAHVVNSGLLCVVAWWCHVDGTMAACLPWLVAWGVLSVFGSHSIKGLALYAKFKAGPQMSASTSTAITADLAKVVESVAKARESGHYQEAP